LDDFYVNANAVSTWGTEVILKYQNPIWGRFQLNYALYQSVKDTSNDLKAVDAAGNVIHQAINLSFPTHKVTFNHNIPITHSLSFNHSMIFSSDRYGYRGAELIHFSPTWVYNTYFRYQDAFVPGLELGLGVYDLFNAQYKYVQLFNGAHPALPGATREVRFKLSYAF